MAVITRLEPSKHIQGRYLVFFGEELVKVTEEEILSFTLYKGRDLTDEELETLRQAGHLSCAKSAAARMLGSKPMSRGELIQKLTVKGEDPAAAKAAADRLEELGVINDAAYAAMVVRHYSSRGYGLKKLESELYRRKVPREYWSAALEEQGDAEETIDRLIERKLRGKIPDEKELGRLQGFLLRRGFSWSQVQEGLERMHNA